MEACGFCGEQSIGWCVVCGAPLCDGCGVPVRDFDRLCPDCARPPAGEAVREGIPVAVSIVVMRVRYMAQEDIGRRLGKGRTTVNVWRARYKDTGDPFPEPDADVGLGDHPLPGWLPERMDDIWAWLGRHPRLGGHREG